MNNPLSKRSQYEVLRAQLDMERSSFMPHWRDLGEFILPRRPRFTQSDVNKGDRRNNKIIDSTASMAARTLRSGMMSGVTSPARPWFKLSTPDPDMAEYGPVKLWLDLVTQRMGTVFLKSNLYNALPIVYGDIGTFGTNATFIDEDFTGSVIRAFPFPIGSYMISNNENLQVDTFIRDFRMTVRQLVKKFGAVRPDTGTADWSMFSQTVRNAWDKSQYETWIDVVHLIRPNNEHDPRKLSSKNKRYSSCYYEGGQTKTSEYMSRERDDLFLRESGYDLFPVLAPRWEVTGEDSYGTSCPGMDCLGDVKQLQLGEKRAMQAIDKMVNPPMIAPSTMKSVKTTILPGDINYSDAEGPKGFRPAHEIDFRIMELEQKQAQVRSRIQRSFYEDLFLMLSQSDRRDITAREIEERHEEKLLALGPVLEQLNQDALDPLIDITFDKMLQQGLIPPAPKELQGQGLRVEYISVMAQAQKLVGLAGIERFAGFVQNMHQTMPEASITDKVDADQMVDDYANITGVPTNIVRTDEQVAAIRQQRAQAQQAQQAAATMKDGATAAKTLSQANMESDNGLTRLIQAGQAGQMVQQ